MWYFQAINGAGYGKEAKISVNTKKSVDVVGIVLGTLFSVFLIVAIVGLSYWKREELQSRYR